MHLGIARLLGILGRGRCIDDPRLREDRIDDRASRNLKSVGCEVPLCLLKQRPAQIALLQQVTEATHCRLVGHRPAADINADKATHRVGWPPIASECPPEAAPSQASTYLKLAPRCPSARSTPARCRAAAGLVYFIFDLLHLDGDDVGALPLIERKARLAALLSGVVPPLGFRAQDRKLVIVDSEAELIRSIFRRYAELGSVRLLKGGSRNRGIKSGAGIRSERRGGYTPPGCGCGLSGEAPA
jgi:hypothetical protein